MTGRRPTLSFPTPTSRNSGVAILKSRQQLLIATTAALALLGGAGALAEPSKEACPADGSARPWLNKALSPSCRVGLVLKELKSAEDKLDIIGATPPPPREASPADASGPPLAFFMRPDPLLRFGLNGGRGGDGPAGFEGGTAWPTPLTIAASFDTATARKYGDALGEELIRAGRNAITGPAMDISRTWRFGRVTESYGEDPLLAGAMAATEIKAIQAHHVIATAKHFALYAQEQDRAGDTPLNSKPAPRISVSERAMREIYLPAFKAAVEQGGVGGIMCSFANINGVHACENPELLGILKNEWGFDGIVGPDFPNAQKTIVAAFKAGLDSGTMIDPGPGMTVGFNGERLSAAVASSEISPARLDDLVRRRLAPGFRLGVFDHPATHQEGDITTQSALETAAELVADGAVLLKNERGILPLGPTVKRLAIIGQQAGSDAIVTEQGSASVTAAHHITVIDAVRKRMGEQGEVRYAEGIHSLKSLPQPPQAVFTAPDGARGFKAEYFTDTNLKTFGTPVVTRVEPSIAIDRPQDIAGLPAGNRYSVRWTGRITPTTTGVHHFTLEGSGSGRLYVNGVLKDYFDRADFGSIAYADVKLPAGKQAEVRVEWSPRVAPLQPAVHLFGQDIGTILHFGYAPPDNKMEAAVAAARSADVAIVFAGHRVGEGMDRSSLSLPGEQDALIRAVAGANKNTIVVLNTGGAVAMPWLKDVAAVLEMWLPGDAQGAATAQLLFGDATPKGRLPITFPANERQGPAVSPETYPGRENQAGAITDVTWSEGLEVGYRYWDAHDQTPLFPFGFGLSYTPVSMTRSSVRKDAGGVTVTASLRNLGQRTDTDVVQVYVGFPAAAGEPPKRLVGFEKVALEPGQERTVEMALPETAFQIWDEAAHAWSTPAGRYQVMVGRSSRDIQSIQTLDLP